MFRKVVVYIKKRMCWFFFSLLPATKGYAFKAYILRTIGLDIDTDARLVSSFKVIGIDNLKVGSRTFIGHNTIIIGSQKSTVTIGSNCDISSSVIIVTGTHEIDLVGERVAGKGGFKNVEIKDGAWIGINSTILPGVTIGKKSVVAAGSVVVRDVPDFTLVAGNPAITKKRLSTNVYPDENCNEI